MAGNREILAERLAEAALEIGAIKLGPEKPFQWASGYHMPIYNDNRKLLGDYQHRRLVTENLTQMINDAKIETDYVSGTSTAGHR